MALSDKMNNKAETKKVFAENERAFRLQQKANYWASIPEIGAGFENLDESTRLNLACNLNNQANYMSRLTENQLASDFKGFTPENMLRLVRLAMPNIVRSKIFTEFAMETARDSIKYVRPVYSKAIKEDADFEGRYDDSRIFDDEEGTFNSVNGENARRAMYETTEDRPVQDLYAVTATGADTSFTATFNNEKVFGTNGEKFINGYCVVYANIEKNVLAIQDKNTGKFFGTEGVKAEYDDATKAVTVTLVGNTTVESLKEQFGIDGDLVIKVLGRFDSEGDYEGENLGEIEIKMSDYEFRPRRTSIGVTWSQLTELTLDTSFNMSAQEYLITYASQAIKVALDNRAIKTAYQIAKTNPTGYQVEFDAAYADDHKDSYSANAQTFLSAVSTVGDNMLNDINRGGVSRIVAGPSAGTYCQLMVAFTPKGAQIAEGAHQIGELAGIPVFKVSNQIIPSDEMLCVWKNPANDADIAIAFGTLVPFYSTGVIARKNFYKEAGLASYGDYAVLNRRYMSIIKIKNLKDSTK